LALTPKDNEAFYREVDEELRREQVQGLVRRYGIFVGILVLLLLAALGGYFWWQNEQERRAGEQAETLNAIYTDIDSGKAKEVGPRLDKLAAEGNEGYRLSALLTKAALAAQDGNDAAAIATYKSIAADADAAQPYRDLALVRQTAMEYDKLAPALVVERLKPIAMAGNPWFGSAGEMVALAYMKQQKPELAAPIFAAMAKDERVPATIQTRAEQMAQSLGIDTEQTGKAGATKE
jgi:hypothetical protein